MMLFALARECKPWRRLPALNAAAPKMPGLEMYLDNDAGLLLIEYTPSVFTLYDWTPAPELSAANSMAIWRLFNQNTEISRPISVVPYLSAAKTARELVGEHCASSRA